MGRMHRKTKFPYTNHPWSKEMQLTVFGLERSHQENAEELDEDCEQRDPRNWAYPSQLRWLISCLLQLVYQWYDPSAGIHAYS
jgi:hypothetical protein